MLSIHMTDCCCFFLAAELCGACPQVGKSRRQLGHLLTTYMLPTTFLPGCNMLALLRPYLGPITIMWVCNPQLLSVSLGGSPCS